MWLQPKVSALTTTLTPHLFPSCVLSLPPPPPPLSHSQPTHPDVEVTRLFVFPSLSFRYILVAVQELLGESLQPLNSYTVQELLNVTRSIRQDDSSRSLRQADSSRSLRQADSSRSLRQADSSRSLRQADSSRSLRQVDSSSTSRPYVAANLTWQELGEFQLGDGAEYGGFVNKPLTSGADYETTLFGERFDGMIIVYSPQKFSKFSRCILLCLCPFSCVVLSCQLLLWRRQTLTSSSTSLSVSAWCWAWSWCSSSPSLSASVCPCAGRSRRRKPLGGSLGNPRFE